MAPTNRCDGDRRHRRSATHSARVCASGYPGAPAIAVLRAAVDAGVNHIDTAQTYGAGGVNELIREALHPYPDELALVSKVAARRDKAGALLPKNDPNQLRAPTSKRT